MKLKKVYLAIEAKGIDPSKIKSGIRAGTQVKQGQVIGYVGSTGLATGNHVCYRFWKNQVQVDHRRENFPSVGPIAEEYRMTFEDLKSRYLLELQTETDLPYGAAYASLFKTASLLQTDVPLVPNSTVANLSDTD